MLVQSQKIKLIAVGPGSEGFQQLEIPTGKAPSDNTLFDTYEQAAMLSRPRPTGLINGRREQKKPRQSIQKAKYILEPAFTYSEASVDLVPQLGELMYKAIETSQQWKMERAAGEETTDCFTTIIPEDTNADISITLLVGQRAGMQFLEKLKLKPTWSSLLGHLVP